MSDGNTTDAMPSPPRDQNNQYQNKSENIKHRSSFRSNKGVFDEESFPKPPPSQQVTVINVQNSKVVHIGTVNNYNMCQSNKNKGTPKVEPTESINALRKSKNPVTEDDILFLSDHMNSKWVTLARHFKYSQGKIEQFGYKRTDLKEIIYQFLLDWIRNNGTKKATVGVLAEALWQCDQQEALNIWSQQYSS
ncbi:protein immune deficiency [Sitophilus oryzae]|uniref:Protein immune deficiency n=1 Tax=Sitophilus oryzae TaxID=7048 RepID=A0A6J2XB00_SITOR|nr:protein immune deficiency [Sitophilus oryzae]